MQRLGDVRWIHVDEPTAYAIHLKKYGWCERRLERNENDEVGIGRDHLFYPLGAEFDPVMS